MSIQAIYENGVFRPLEPVNLPEHSLVEVNSPSPEAEVELWDSIYETLSERFNSGDPDVAERHNEHQP